MLLSPGTQEMPAFASAAFASAAFACTADDVRQSMVLTWFAFLQTPEHLKTETAEESFNPDGLAQRSIKLLKDKFPDIEVSLLVQPLTLILPWPKLPCHHPPAAKSGYTPAWEALTAFICRCQESQLHMQSPGTLACTCWHGQLTG